MDLTGVLHQFDIAGRSAIVTGGASGLGLAFCETLAEAGVHLTLLDRAEAKGAREAARLGARFALADIIDRTALRCVFDAHVAEWGALDILFANAGIGGGAGVRALSGDRSPAREIDVLDEAEWDRVIAVNLTGTFNTIRLGAAAMKAAGTRGSIIVTTSNAALVNELIVGLPYMPAKAGAAHLTRQAALELAPYGIRVNAIAPGPFVTDIAGGRMKDPVIQEGWRRHVPLGDLANPEWIKPLALYLASDASRYVTGSQIVIDGGMSLGTVG